MSKKARITAAVKAQVFAAHTCCAACGTWDADECGHLVAEANGGEATASNLVRLCGNCNRAQGIASVVFAEFASYTESRALVTSRRAYWAKYCNAARGATRIKPYRPA